LCAVLFHMLSVTWYISDAGYMFANCIYENYYFRFCWKISDTFTSDVVVCCLTMCHYLDYAAQHRIVRWLMNDELKMVWKEAILVYWATVLTFAWRCWGKLRETAVKIAGMPAEIRTKQVWSAAATLTSRPSECQSVLSVDQHTNIRDSLLYRLARIRSKRSLVF
jgi:hypothetical protein